MEASSFYFLLNINYLHFGLLTGDAGTEGVETDVDVLVTAVNLVDVADHACTLC